MASPQGRSSRNGTSSKPGPPSRKNTFQRMLELERNAKIERMRASAPETQVSYRQTPPASYFPSTPVQARQRERQTSTAAETKESASTSPASLTNNNLNQGQTPTRRSRHWSEQPGYSNSIDSYLHESTPESTKKHSGTIASAKQAPGTQSASALEINDLAEMTGIEEPQSGQQPTWERQRMLNDLDAKGRIPIAASGASNENKSQEKATMNPKRPNVMAPRSLSAFNILPPNLSITVPRERSTSSQAIPQLDGCAPSKSLLSPADGNVLPRSVSDRSSICRSPSWSLTNGERGKREKRAKKMAAKTAKEAKAAKEKEAKAAKEREERKAKAAKEREEREAKEAKAAREKQEKEEKGAREKQEREEKAREKEEKAREKEEKEREKEAKAANKKQKRQSKPTTTPRKLVKGDRSFSMPIVPTSISRLTPSSRLNSFQSTDSAVDSARQSFQTKPAAIPDDGGFIGGFQLTQMRNAAATNAQTEGGEKEEDVVRPVVVAGRRFGLDGSDDEEDVYEKEFEMDMVRNAYHLALNDTAAAQPHTVEESTLRIETARDDDISPSEQPQQDIADYLGKPKSPFYQISEGNNSFVDEIFHTVQKKRSNSSSNSKVHPLRSHPSMEYKRSEDKIAVENESNGDRPELPREHSYDATSFAARMAKKSESLEKLPLKVQDDVKNETRHKYGEEAQRPSSAASSSAESLRAERLAAAVGTDLATVSMQNSNRHQVKVLEGVKTKSHSMLIEQLIVGEEDQDDTDEQAAAVEETKQEENKNRGSRSSSRESSWFRRYSKEEPKLSIQERRRSRGRSLASIDRISNENQGAKDIEHDVGEKSEKSKRTSISPTITSFKAAAKAAFSKYGPAAPSSRANLPSSSLNRPVSTEGGFSANPASKDQRRLTLPSSVTMPSMAKADKVLGENLSFISMSDGRMSAEQIYGSTSSSLTTKGSYEEVSSSAEDVENTSTITTPTASRPTSTKEQLLTLKSTPIVQQPGGRFRDEFSAEFLSALDRGDFEMSPVEEGDTDSPGYDVSSIVPTPIASPTEGKVDASTTESKSEGGGALIAEAIARVATFALPTDKTPAKAEEAPPAINEKAKEEKAPPLPSIPKSSRKPNPTPPLFALTRQPSIKSASTSDLPNLKNSSLDTANSKPEIDFSFLPPLKHESLVRPARASASPSLQALAQSVLGPPSSKVAKPNGLPIGVASSRNVSSPIPPSTYVPPLLSSSARPSSLPPRNRRQQEQAVSSPSSSPSSAISKSIKASWLAAISNETPPLSLPSPSTTTTNTNTPPPTPPISIPIPLPTPKEFPFSQARRSSSSSESNADTKSTTRQIMLKNSAMMMNNSSSSNFQLTSNLIKHPLAGGTLDDPYAKCFVICCGCKRFHDMPSRVYETLLRGGLAAGEVGSAGSGKESEVAGLGGGVVGTSAVKGKGVSKGGEGGGGEKEKEVGRLVMKSGGKVVCPWCEHVMSTGCCENWAICVKLVERLS